MLKYTVKKYCSEGSKINQLLIASLMVWPVFCYGMAVGWMSPMGPILMSNGSPSSSPLDSEVISWMASVPYLVGAVAVFFYGYLVDNFGRKKALMFTSFNMVLCWSLKLYSAEPWALITARAIIGFGVAGAYVVTPLYIKEISEDSIRGTLGSLVILAQNLGNLIMFLIGEYMSYDMTLWVCIAVPLAHLVLFTAMPDTPSFLIKSGKTEEARSVLAWLRCRDPTEAEVESELQILLCELEQKQSCGLVDATKTIFSDRSTSRAFRISIIITLARELCGCLAVLHFASLIFKKAGNGWVLTANQQAAVLGAVQLVGSFTASSLVERTGRKPLLAITCVVSGLAMATLGAWFRWSGGGDVTVAGGVVTDAGGDITDAGGDITDALVTAPWLPVAALCLCIYCDAAGLQPVPFVVMTEMFTFQLRGTVTTLIISFACILVSFELRVFQPLASHVGLYFVFWVFAGVCIISTVYIVLWVPETKMRSIDEIYAEINGKKKDSKDCEADVTRL